MTAGGGEHCEFWGFVCTLWGPTAFPLLTAIRVGKQSTSQLSVQTSGCRESSPKTLFESALLREKAAMLADPAALPANFGIVSTSGEGAFSMPVFAKTICVTLKPSHMPQHRWVKGLFFLFESQRLWTAVPAKEFL